ncbi:ORC-CDC6 family AAA ATPase [Paraburkholderia caffeinilytica]|uniref:ORC-CDC6 family AAA ATPase n=1 Tax=Paraburkholderia caffeinilytica TaxID=1761016 RepID=UPI0038BA5775
MSEAPKNPFSSALATEQIEPDAFVEYFSDALVSNAVGFFDLGNVVVKGTPGSGKSMLLTLLKPETRVAYFRHGEQFPVGGDDAKFISGGINLTRAGAHDFTNRLARNSRQGIPFDDLVLLFADFFNYFVCLDLLKSIRVFLANDLEPLRKEIGLSLDLDRLNAFAASISGSDCWFHYLEGTQDFENLIKKIERRLLEYRSYFNFNIDQLSPDFLSSKTSVGEPIAAMAAELRRSGVLSPDTKVFIRVDQLEELYSLEREHGLGDSYRQIINKALGMRDPRMGYRLGTRDYAWERQPAIYGTSSKLEQNRDYSVISLEEMLRRKENRRGWLFPELAQDIFARRLHRAAYALKDSKTALRDVLSDSPPREELARRYLSGKARPVGTEDKYAIDASDLPAEVAAAIEKIAQTDPLDAQLATAWVRQRAQRNLAAALLAERIERQVWRQRTWWVKERKELALLHLAGRMNQRLMWGGADDVLELSGYNALVFISICRHIWQVAIRSDARSLQRQGPILIDFDTQATGIYDASRSWAEKQIPRGMRGDERFRLVSTLGAHFRRTLIGDRAMSNPGKNGISLTLEDLEDHADLKKLLAFSSDFGDLVVLPHTTKLKDQKPRRKWYLAPILSPYFRIPHVHTKEPIYLTAEELTTLLGGTQQKLSLISVADTTNTNDQLNLF